MGNSNQSSSKQSSCSDGHLDFLCAMWWPPLRLLSLLWVTGLGYPDSLPEVLARIVEPSFPDRTFSVADFSSGNLSDDLPAFRAAIQACNASGGGTVLVPSGSYYLGGPL